MRAARFFKLRAELDQECLKLLRAKNREYAETGDFLGNFNTAANMLKCSPSLVAASYFYKHCRSIFHQLSGGEISAGEDIISRIRDARNYLDFLYALIYEKQCRKIK
jgi:hypothetical protein